MPVVRVEPAAIEFTVAEGHTVMEGALTAGYAWPTVCGGVGTCTVCHVRVLAGSDALSRTSASERETLAPLLGRYPGSDPNSVRLACQARVHDDVTVFRRGVRPKP